VPDPPLLVGIGGFLGAGKTTAIVQAAPRLRTVSRFCALPRLSSDVSYLFGQQLAEADLLRLNKVDALAPDDLW
jgi:G3E family GTPase